jgi:hypothetical protein
MNILHISSVSLISAGGTKTRDLFTKTFGLPLGKPEWPKGKPVPQLSIELEVKDEAAVAAAEQELRAQGHDVLHATRKEPWGQTVCRLLSAEGVIVGVSYAPWQHEG